VGDQAGLSHTAAAHYYRDKPGLFTSYITRAYNEVGARIEEASKTNNPQEAMLDAACAYASFAVDSPAAFSVMQRLELTRVDTAELWTARQRCYFGIDAILERLQSAGWAPEKELRDLLSTTWAFVHGFVDLWVGGPLAAPYTGEELEPTLRRLFGELLDVMG